MDSIQRQARICARATLRVGHVVDRLISRPIDAEIYWELQRYLQEDGWRAVDAQARLVVNEPTVLRTAIAELEDENS